MKEKTQKHIYRPNIQLHTLFSKIINSAKEDGSDCNHYELKDK